MRSRLAWLGGLLVLTGLALYRALSGSRPAAPAPASPDPRAEELRRKLAASRTAEPEPEAGPGEDGPGTPDERRHEVHEHGRAAAKKMRAPVDEGGHE